MGKTHIGLVVGGIITGVVLVFQILASLPDGKLHIVFCNVGQGDAVYILFPDGRDMVIDGGPNDTVLGCLGRHMPFWDRTIDVVVLTHPENDHLRGLLGVVERYHVGYVVRSASSNHTEGFNRFIGLIRSRSITEKIVTKGERIAIGDTRLIVLWPSQEQIQSRVLGASTQHLNDDSVVLLLRYGSFDALFPGDADTRVEDRYRDVSLADEYLELLKVPHHGSQTGISETFLAKLKPRIAVISVGKNSYGHPSPDVLQMLAHYAGRVLTTLEGDREIISDGVGWSWR